MDNKPKPQPGTPARRASFMVLVRQLRARHPGKSDLELEQMAQAQMERTFGKQTR